MGEQRVTLQLLHHRDHAVVAADPQVVPLGHIVGEDHPRVLADPAQHGEEHVAFQRLGLVDDDEGVVQRTAADVGQRQDLQHVPGEHLLDHVPARHRPQGVEDRLRPRRHLLPLAAGEVPEFLAADGVQGTEDKHLRVQAPLQHRLQPRTERQRRFAGARPSTQRDDPHVRVEQEVERNPLFGGASVDSEGFAVALDKPDGPVRQHPSKRRGTRAVQHHTGVTGQVDRLGHDRDAVGVQAVDGALRHVRLDHPRPPSVGSELVAVFLRGQADRGRLDPQRKVLTDQDHVVPLRAQVQRHGKDPGIVVAQPEAGRQDVRVGVVQFDLDGALGGVDGDGCVQTSVADAEVVQPAQRRPGEVAQFGMVALGLQFGDDHHRHDDSVLGEVAQSLRIAQQHRGVDDIGLERHSSGAGA